MIADAIHRDVGWYPPLPKKDKDGLVVGLIDKQRVGVIYEPKHVEISFAAHTAENKGKVINLDVGYRSRDWREMRRAKYELKEDVLPEGEEESP